MQIFGVRFDRLPSVFARPVQNILDFRKTKLSKIFPLFACRSPTRNLVSRIAPVLIKLPVTAVTLHVSPTTSDSEGETSADLNIK